MRKINYKLIMLLLIIMSLFTNSCDKRKHLTLNPIISSIVISHDNTDIKLGSIVNFTATVSGINNPPQTVTWSVIGNASLDTNIDSNGILNIATTETATPLTIRATSTFDTTKNGEIEITINYPIITSVVIKNDITEFFPGDVINFTAMVTGDNDPPQTVKWTVSGNESGTTIIYLNGGLNIARNETAISLTIQATSTYDTSISESVIILNNIINFVGIEWIVLERKDEKTLVISKNVVSYRSYHNNNSSVSWEDSSIRAYLNGQFYNSFGSNDRSRIVEVTITNEDNQYFGTPGGNDTQDKIFLLSLSEVVHYFGDSGKLGSTSVISDQFNSNRIARYLSVDHCWWLRSPGRYEENKSEIQNKGSIDLIGSRNLSSCGIRPALWLIL